RDSAEVVTPFVQVGTYPTRNFARIHLAPLSGGAGLYLFRLEIRPAIHLRRDPSNLLDPLGSQVSALLHQQDDVPELEKIDRLLRSQQMLLEERNDLLAQVIQAPNAVRHPVAVVRTDHAAPEEVLECVQELHVALMLDHREFREHLESGRHLRMPVHADEETAFA